MKIHDVFHLNFLRANFENFLFDQKFDISKPVKTLYDNEWLIDDILNFKHFDRYNRLQYKIK